MRIDEMWLEAQEHRCAEDLDGQKKLGRFLGDSAASLDLAASEATRFYFGRLEDDLQQVVSEEKAENVMHICGDIFEMGVVGILVGE